jgi:hypothetical protein
MYNSCKHSSTRLDECGRMDERASDEGPQVTRPRLALKGRVISDEWIQTFKGA